MAKRKAARGSGRKPAAKRRGSGRTRAAAKKTAASRKIARKAAQKATRKAAVKARTSRKAPARRSKSARPRVVARAKTPTVRRVAAKAKPTAKAKPKAQARTSSSAPPSRRASAKSPGSSTKNPRSSAKNVRPQQRTAPGLNRERRTIVDDELVPSPPSSLDLDRSASAARSGRRELLEKYEEHTETGPAMTGGDVDADWESAYSVGDEAPGGDNPTPDQDIVDDIGRAVGVEYQDNEELKGARKISDRDRHRWELDPASSDDWEDR
jgi:hypothetical protein